MQEASTILSSPKKQRFFVKLTRPPKPYKRAFVVTTVGRDNMEREILSDPDDPDLSVIAKLGMSFINGRFGLAVTRAGCLLMEWAYLRGLEFNYKEKRIVAKSHWNVWQEQGLAAEYYHLKRSKELYDQIIYLPEYKHDTAVHIEYLHVLMALGSRTACDAAQYLLKMAYENEEQDLAEFNLYCGANYKDMRKYNQASDCLFESGVLGPPKHMHGLDVLFLVTRNVNEWDARTKELRGDHDGIRHDYTAVFFQSQADNLVHRDLSYDAWFQNRRTWLAVAEKCAYHSLHLLVSDLIGQALIFDPTAYSDGRMWFRLAKAYFRSGRTPDALSSITQALAYAPDVEQYRRTKELWDAKANTFEYTINACGIAEVMEMLPPAYELTVPAANRLRRLHKIAVTRWDRKLREEEAERQRLQAAQEYTGAPVDEELIKAQRKAREKSKSKKTPKIMWKTPSPIVFPTRLNKKILSAVVKDIDGELEYKPANLESDPLPAGVHRLFVEFVPNNTDKYNISDASVELVVEKALPFVYWKEPPPIYVGSRLTYDLHLDGEVRHEGEGGIYSVDVTGRDSPKKSEGIRGKGRRKGHSRRGEYDSEVPVLALSPSPSPSPSPSRKGKGGSSPSPSKKKKAKVVDEAAAASAIAHRSFGLKSKMGSDAHKTGLPKGTFQYRLNGPNRHELQPPGVDLSEVVLPVGKHALLCIFTPTDSLNYSKASADTWIEVMPQEVPVVTWRQPPAIVYLDRLDDRHLNAQCITCTGTFQYFRLVSRQERRRIVWAGAVETTETETQAGGTKGDKKEQEEEKQEEKEEEEEEEDERFFEYIEVVDRVPVDVGTVLPAGTSMIVAEFTPHNQVRYTGNEVGATIKCAKFQTALSWPNPPSVYVGDELQFVTHLAAVVVDSVDGEGSGVFTYTATVKRYEYFPLAPSNLQSSSSSSSSSSLSPTQPSSHKALLISTASPSSPTAGPSSPQNSSSQLTSPTTRESKVGLDGLGICNIPPLPKGHHLLHVRYAPRDRVNFLGSTLTVPLTVRCRPILEWDKPTLIRTGTALSAEGELNCRTADCPGEFIYTPAEGTRLEVGHYVLHARFRPDDASVHDEAEARVSLTVLRKLVPKLSWRAADLTYGQPVGEGVLCCQADVPGSFRYSLARGKMLDAGSHSVIATFTPHDPVTYAGASTVEQLVVKPLQVCVEWDQTCFAAGLMSIAYGTPISDNQLCAMVTFPPPEAIPSFFGEMRYSVADGALLPAGLHEVTATFVPAAKYALNFLPASLTVTLEVRKFVPSLLWASRPPRMLFGRDLLTHAHLDAHLAVSTLYLDENDEGDDDGEGESKGKGEGEGEGEGGGKDHSSQRHHHRRCVDIEGSIAYIPALGEALPHAGKHVLRAVFTPRDGHNIGSCEATAEVVVSRAQPVVTWPSLEPVYWGAALTSRQLCAQVQCPGLLATDGQLVYTPARREVLPVGTHILKVAWVPFPHAARNFSVFDSWAQVPLLVKPKPFDMETLDRLLLSTRQTQLHALMHGDKPRPNTTRFSAPRLTNHPEPPPERVVGAEDDDKPRWIAPSAKPKAGAKAGAKSGARKKRWEGEFHPEDHAGPGTMDVRVPRPASAPYSGYFPESNTRAPAPLLSAVHAASRLAWPASLRAQGRGGGAGVGGESSVVWDEEDEDEDSEPFSPFASTSASGSFRGSSSLPYPATLRAPRRGRGNALAAAAAAALGLGGEGSLLSLDAASSLASVDSWGGGGGVRPLRQQRQSSAESALSPERRQGWKRLESIHAPRYEDDGSLLRPFTAEPKLEASGPHSKRLTRRVGSASPSRQPRDTPPPFSPVLSTSSTKPPDGARVIPDKGKNKKRVQSS
jgi:tetratricopeptide (TPR) repeat protein